MNERSPSPCPLPRGEGEEAKPQCDTSEGNDPGLHAEVTGTDGAARPSQPSTINHQPSTTSRPKVTGHESREQGAGSRERIEVVEGRAWRVPLSPEEMGLHTWVTRQTKTRLADYLRSALDEKARAEVKALIARGKKIPPWVGKMLDKS